MYVYILPPFTNYANLRYMSLSFCLRLLETKNKTETNTKTPKLISLPYFTRKKKAVENLILFQEINIRNMCCSRVRTLGPSNPCE